MSSVVQIINDVFFQDMKFAKNQSKPADLEKSLKLCPNCGKLVIDLSRHRRMHEFQSWGYKCPLCCHFETRFNKSYMVQHLKLQHMSDINVVSCKFDVPQGYSQLLTCGLCNFNCLNKEILDTHMSIHHKEPIKICTSSFVDEFQISDQNCELGQNFENLLEETAEMLQKKKKNSKVGKFDT